MSRASQREEQDKLRARMRAAGMSHDEIAIEFTRRYRYRPRAAHRHARGWTQNQAADHINTHAARAGLDPDGTAPMTGVKISEIENWPIPNNRRKPTPQLLALLADVYDTSIHNLIDLDDREHFYPADLLLIDKTSKSARPQPVELSGPTGRQSDRTDVGAMVEPTAAQGSRSLAELCTTPVGRHPEVTTYPMTWETAPTTEAVDKITRDDLALDRREAGRAMADVIVGAALLEGAERWLNTTEPPAGQRRTAGVGNEEIEQIELAARTFRAWDHQFGGGLRRKAVVGQLAEIADELRDFSHPQSLTRRLHGVMADLAGTAATMSWDSGQGGIAQRYYLLALRSAKAADDPVFCANILAGMARQQFYLGRTTEGLELVRLAQDVAGARATPAVRAMLFTREAWAYARQGRLSAFRRATGRAQDAFRDVDAAVEPYWISYFDQAELAGVTGGRLLDIAHEAPEYADEAATWLSQAVRARGVGSVRGTALDQIGHAEIRLVQGELDEAARLGHAAVTTVEQTRSSRVRVKLGEFYRHAETKTSARPIAELCGRIKPILRAEDTTTRT
ncbi:HTH cro/C1-type domain-containing protein [Frankia sp. AiPs1]|uniref:helix-turn-helix transcriptional regulator n=1 Tax=Frankia sp. AiPa1 TaxID=573492 RepID=UPI00202B0A7E|nr:helix-turn-helix transcriptional regulator [Frankia sp. AiPa1]MCL9762982.1 helix-turn-helix transcriptional regulator [Frankia sp. AiPa1]